MSPSVTDLEPTPVTGPSQGAPYGYCPICGAHGQTRERRPDGYDRCTCGHLYRSCEALPIPPTPDECVYFRHYGVRHPTLVRRNEALAVSVPTVVQAEDRIHRIGQTEPCTVHYLSAEGTLDEAMARSIASKTDALNIVLGGGDRNAAALEKINDDMSLDIVANEGPREPIAEQKVEAAYTYAIRSGLGLSGFASLISSAILKPGITA